MDKLSKNVLKNLSKKIEKDKKKIQEEKDSVLSIDNDFIDLLNEEDNKVETGGDTMAKNTEISAIDPWDEKEEGSTGLVIPDFEDLNDDQLESNEIVFDEDISNDKEEVQIEDNSEEISLDSLEEVPLEDLEEITFEEDETTVTENSAVGEINNEISLDLDPVISDDNSDDDEMISITQIEEDDIPELPTVMGDTSKIEEMIELIHIYQDKLTPVQITDLTLKAKDGIDVTESIEQLLTLNGNMQIKDISEVKVEAPNSKEDEEREISNINENLSSVNQIDLDGNETEPLSTVNNDQEEVIDSDPNQILKTIVAVDGEKYVPTIDRKSLKDIVSNLHKNIYSSMDPDFKNYRIIKRRLDKALQEDGEIAIAVKESDIRIADTSIPKILADYNLPAEKYSEGYIISFRTLTEQEKGYRTGLHRFIEELEASMSENLSIGKPAAINLLRNGLPRLTEEELSEILEDLKDFEIKISDDAFMTIDLKDI